MTATERAWIVGNWLASAARYAHRKRQEISEDRTVREIAAEFAGVLDVLTGLDITSPEARLDAHLARIEQLRRELPDPDAPAVTP